MAKCWLTKAIRLPSGGQAPSVTVSVVNVNAVGVPPCQLIVLVPFVALSPIESPVWLADAPLIATMGDDRASWRETPAHRPSVSEGAQGPFRGSRLPGKIANASNVAAGFP